MTAANLITAARLWDEEAVAGTARRWADTPTNHWWMGLKSSQLGALERAVEDRDGPVPAVRDLNGYLVLCRLRRFLQAAAARGKGRTKWMAENGRSLRASFREALLAGRDTGGRFGDAFAACREGLDACSLAEARVRRDEAILRSYLGALAKIHRSKGAPVALRRECDT